MSTEKSNSFTFVDEENENKTIALAPADFTLVHENKVLTDTKMKSKPTTFFKDAMKRFAKNKSSVLGAIILGILLLLAFILPAALPSDITSSHPYEKQLAPKLFDTGVGWWDGTKAYNHIAVDVDWDHYDATGEIVGLPSEFLEKDIVGGRSGITMGKVGDEYTDNISAYAHGGYIRVNHAPKDPTQTVLSSWNGVSFDFTDTANRGYSLAVTTADSSNFSNWSFGDGVPYSFYFVWTDPLDGKTLHELPLKENITTYGDFTFNLSTDYIDQIKTLAGYSTKGNASLQLIGSASKPHFEARLITTGQETNTTNLVIQKVIFTSTDATQADDLKSLSCYDANDALSILAVDSDGKKHDFYWSTLNGKSNLFRANIIFCSFRIDTYEEAYGDYDSADITLANINTWYTNGLITGDFSKINDYASYTDDTERTTMIDNFVASIQYTEKGKIHCPLVLDSSHALTGKSRKMGGKVILSFSGTMTKWKELYPNANEMPRFIFGTDNSGRDMLKYVFTGLRTSLLLGVLTSVVCFLFGLVWGAISGYFGGWVDIAMERFVEILSGVPWIVIMTLAIILYGSNFTTFALALCLTGWIGTAGITRTQFYRFKDREYILAARTLGASDFRLIFRHILPNAVGTIITSSVLMIPSVIFSEATISYLNLGLKGMASLGVILSQNQKYISTNPMLIIFPSIIMALIMISFNLFGNGLRDAFNPSLKGEE
jgi:ABC-type dipeptide/oligopeptide/nickel transport system permease subunit